MKKPQNIEDARALVAKQTEAMGKKRREHMLAERNYLKAKEWERELEALLAIGK